jgi:hypothetical protein
MCTDNGALSYADAVEDRDSSAEPSMFPNRNSTLDIHRPGDERLLGGAFRMVARPYVAIGTDERTFTDLDARVSGDSTVRADITSRPQDNRSVLRSYGRKPPDTYSISYFDTPLTTSNIERRIVIYENAAAKRYLLWYPQQHPTAYRRPLAATGE